MWLEAGIITWTLILEGGAPTKLGRAKKLEKFEAISDF